MTGHDGRAVEGAESVVVARSLVELSRADAEVLIRFAAEFVCRAKYAEATPEGLEAAYLATVPIEGGYEDVHIFLQDLGERVHDALGEDFHAWARQEVPVRRLADGIAGPAVGACPAESRRGHGALPSHVR
jgi:hypothetical protein